MRYLLEIVVNSRQNMSFAIADVVFVKSKFKSMLRSIVTKGDKYEIGRFRKAIWYLRRIVLLGLDGNDMSFIVWFWDAVSMPLSEEQFTSIKTWHSKTSEFHFIFCGKCEKCMSMMTTLPAQICWFSRDEFNQIFGSVCSSYHTFKVHALCKYLRQIKENFTR